MHKSIFVKIKNYNSDPVHEYNKIFDFISKKGCFYDYGWVTILDLFKQCFDCCKLLRPIYKDLDDCLSKNISKLNDYHDIYDFYSLDDDVQEELLDEFLTFCEIIACMYKITYDFFVIKHLYDHSFEKDTYEQANEMLEASLKSINYKVATKNNGEIEIIKINPIAEYVGEQSKPSIKMAIISYLGARDNDVDDKETKLHRIIDLIEPLLKKYSSQENIGKVKEYVQIIRHPEPYKEKNEYKWFFDNKEQYIDDIFDMCIYAIQYEISKKIINKFDSKKMV